jgi:16S rRNA (adenine1518-N6/adenine1519-N6)-dimethyltransferase
MSLLGIEPKKSLGQNFLISDHVIQKICGAVEDLKPDILFEIGPGLGALTSPLKEKFKNYQLIELDRKFAEFWRQEGMPVIEEDALRIRWDQLPTTGNRVLVSNLPYQISSSLVIDRTLDEVPFDGMVLMFQKEVAQRIRARFRTADYGLLSVIAQMGWEIETLLEASSRDFLPPPKVASRVLVFRKKNASIKNKRKFLSFVKGAFAHRRKLLLNNLVGAIGGDIHQHKMAFETLKIGLKVRAEELSLQQMIDLFKELGYDSRV